MIKFQREEQKEDLSSSKLDVSFPCQARSQQSSVLSKRSPKNDIKLENLISQLKKMKINDPAYSIIEQMPKMNHWPEAIDTCDLHDVSGGLEFQRLLDISFMYPTMFKSESKSEPVIIDLALTKQADSKQLSNKADAPVHLAVSK